LEHLVKQHLPAPIRKIHALRRNPVSKLTVMLLEMLALLLQKRLPAAKRLTLVAKHVQAISHPSEGGQQMWRQERSLALGEVQVLVSQSPHLSEHVADPEKRFEVGFGVGDHGYSCL